jgi:hypothetical protein
MNQHKLSGVQDKLQSSKRFNNWQAGMNYGEKLILKKGFTKTDLDNFIEGMKLAEKIISEDSHVEKD